MEALLSQRDCCIATCPEDSQIITNLPGPPGNDGQDGADGANGLNAYTTLTAGFTMPAEQNDVTIDVVSTAWMVQRQGTIPGQILYIQHAGFMEVRGIVSATKAVVRNLAKISEGLYPENATGAAIPINARVSPGGIQGPQGILPADALLASKNLIELANKAESRTNLGLGTAAVATIGNLINQLPKVSETPGLTTGEIIFASATGLESKAATDAITALGLGSMAIQQKTAVDIDGGSIEGIVPPIPLASGGTGVSVATVAGLRLALGITTTGYGLLGILNVDFSATGDTPVPMTSSRYRIDKVMLENASASLAGSTTLGLYTAVTGGTTLCDQTNLNVMTTADKFVELPLVTTGTIGQDVRKETQLSARKAGAVLTGVTARLRIYGWDFA